jgi:mannose-6-phosphate isomerase-like protein (cupin superfamily)
MVQPGSVISQPGGERWKFLQTPGPTTGEPLRFEIVVQPGGTPFSTLRHLHPLQTERFEVISGQMRLLLNGTEHLYRRGAVVYIPPAAPHCFTNAGPKALHLLAELHPALESARFFETLFAYAQAGQLRPDRISAPLLLAVVVHRYQNHYYLAGPPVALQKLGFALLAPIGKLRGYQAYYPYAAKPHRL